MKAQCPAFPELEQYMRCKVFKNSADVSGLTLKFTHFVSYSIFDPSSSLNPKSTIAFPVKKYYCRGPFPEP